MDILSRRQKDELIFLCNRPNNLSDTVSIQSLSDHFLVSTRTIRNDLKVISDYALEHGFSVTMDQSHSVLLNLNERDKDAVLLEISTIKDRTLHKQERLALTFLLLLFNGRTTYQEIAKLTGTSKQTAVTEFPLVEAQFDGKDVSVVRLRGRGLCLQGEEISIRKCFDRFEVLSNSLKCSMSSTEIACRLFEHLDKIISITLTAIDVLLHRIEDRCDFEFINRKSLILGVLFNWYRSWCGQSLKDYSPIGKIDLPFKDDVLLLIS